MRSAHLVRRVARLERAFGSRRTEVEQDQVLAGLDELSPEQRRERIQYLATKIVKDRGIELLPGERVEDAAVRAIKADLHCNSADHIGRLAASETTSGPIRQSRSRID
jgi:hypothetical protein